ncbi:hypothetical protein LOZ80_16175 [Paenibacillus sp. HWE-109]|uniref:hypothetical protein n=1 Tax=Paenibacillus sp. HWE-109 TaxID=1306526 RepID=UPI001EE05DC3|nr:hypothetical protein [Paenibacillus sp. HWE-109]UKS30386.1 hypothetical protein LOZ80_16175 [Paenibacillus sp. HWE-109]
MLKHMKKVRNRLTPKKEHQTSDKSLLKLYTGPTVLNKTSGVTIVAKGSFDFESLA